MSETPTKAETEIPEVDKDRSKRPAWVQNRGAQFALLALMFGVGGGVAVTWSSAHRVNRTVPHQENSDELKRGRLYRPKESEWASLKIERVENREFIAEYATEGRIQINEDRSTPIFSPYAGRVSSLLAKVGDKIERGQLLFVVEATDMVHAQNDFIAATAVLNKARSTFIFTKITEKRNRDLYDAKAVALKDVQQAQAALTAAQNDTRSAEIAQEAARNRLRILGRTDEEIAKLLESGQINAEALVYAPIGGTVVQRKIGPGQYVNAGVSAPVFVVGDLSTVWLTAFVRETEAAKAEVGQDVRFTVQAYPERVFRGKIEYVAAAIDPESRRLLVRATVDNPNGLLKPEMFANVAITMKGNFVAVGVPREALIYEGAAVRAWVARDDKTIELRDVATGLVNGRIVQILNGLTPGQRIVVKGSLLVDRVAAGT